MTLNRKSHTTAGTVLLFLMFLGSQETYPGDRRTPVVEAVEKAGPAVVNIRTEQVVKRRVSPFFGFADPFFEEFFRNLAPPRTYKTESLGSGVIIDPRGYILTNAHVIAKASKIFVALPDTRKELMAELVAEAERIDVAVLKVSAGKNLPAISPGRADDLIPGETIIAIGNPLGLGHSITTGVVSSPRRQIPMGEDFTAVFIQTDALINPGNSGGPLININGELIGINTAIARQAQGIGFSIPIDTINRVLPDLIQYGRVRRSYLGIFPEPMGKDPKNNQDPGGVMIKGVDNDSPAAAAGIRSGDVITALEGIPMFSAVDMLSFLETYTPENQLRLTIRQGTQVRETTVRLAPLPANYGLIYGERVFGIIVADGSNGLMVRKVVEGSSAAKAGIRPGDLVAEVAGEEVRRMQDFIRVVEATMGRSPVRFLVVREKRGYYVELP